jgi:hypothetical protein
MSKTISQYDQILSECRTLLAAKNADYGDSWRIMRFTSLIDQIKVKIARIDQLCSEGHEAQVSEGVDSEIRDILNYAALSLIKWREENQK